MLVDSVNEEKKEGSQEAGLVSDQRSKKGLFQVRRLELARRWAIKVSGSGNERPIRRIHLRQVEEVRLMTDASPKDSELMEGS